MPYPFLVFPPASPGLSSAHHRSWVSARRGFALLITITLLAFLVLLLVSLASLTRVETQVAANSAQLAQARANALFALNLAVGQLQKYAGPDQRVTARADIDAANVSEPGGPGEPVIPHNPLWTGVWDATPRDSTGVALAAPTHDPVTAPPPAGPLAWLVSGNESNGTALIPSAKAVALPEQDANNVWLLRKVMGKDLSDTETYPDDLSVRLAKSPITVPASQVPGADATGPDVRVGSYAWWVGDEGIKAKINLTDPYRTAASTDAESAWRRGAAPRPDLQLLAKTEFSGAFTGTTTAFETARARLLSYEQLPLLDTALATATTVEQASRYYHDLTSVGQGVLADTLRGGLRRDLTRGLVASPAAGSTAATEIGDSTAVFTLPAPGPVGRTAPTQTYTSNKEPPAPLWSQVRSYWSRRADASNSLTPVDAPLTAPATTAPATQAFLPVPVMLQIGYGVDGSGANYRFMCSPRVVLCNPYNVTLAPAAYKITYRPISSSNSQVTFSFTPASAGTAFKIPATTVTVTQTFTIAADGFAPGEVKVYTPAADVAFDPGADSTVPLSVGYRQTCGYFDTSVVVNPAHQSSTSSVRIVFNTYTGSQQPEITFGLDGAVASQRIRGIELEPKRRGLDTYPLEPTYLYPNYPAVQKPSALVRTPASSREMLAMRFQLRDATMLINSSGNQPGSANHQVPSSHPAYSSSTGGTKSDVAGTRMLIDNNPRAILSQRLGGWDTVAQYGFYPLRGAADLLFPVDANGINGFWGGSIEGDAYGSTHVVLFDVLRQNEEVVSLGRLGQVNWGVDGKHPAYPLGNSFASIFYDYNKPDYGYALNEALWDRFFLSTLPASLASRPDNLPDSRLRFHDPAGSATALTSLEGVNGYQLAATRLMVDGAFNINSTSVEAWAAFLGSVQAADYAYKKTDSSSQTDSAVRVFPRLRNQHDPDPTAPGESGKLYEWTGYRNLDADQLKLLAAQIVAGIKARGRPARSLAEFINRDLSQPAASTANQTGIVQAAIDAVINTDKPAADGSGVGMSDLDGLNTTQRVGTSLVNADNADAATGKLRATGAPGFLMQCDLLTPLAPSMSARSDTFRVRTYGEVRNPVTGDINGRAWCEAVVQRTPEFVDQADSNLTDPSKPTTALGNATAPANTNATNQAFGRKFVIVQFRWLGPDEI